MKRGLFVFALIVALVFSACNPVYLTTIEDGETEDSRLSIVDCASAKWLRKPTVSKAITAKGIADNDPMAAYCTELGWAYMFYDDGAVIGYEPFPDNIEIMFRAVSITVESHNMEFPAAEWDCILVPVPVIPPDTSNDPVLLKWQYCLCIDDGTIVDGPYTAEYDWEWAGWKGGLAALQLASYNQQYDPDAHIVWGPDEDIVEEEEPIEEEAVE